MGIEMSIERITPETAKLMLETQLNSKTVNCEKLAYAIERGKWVLNGSPIVFSSSGRLLDGVGRLSACVATNTSIDTVVVRGVDDDAFDTVDAFRRRTLGDNLKMQGFADAAYLGKMARRLIVGDLYGGLEYSSSVNPSTSRKISIEDYVHFVRENEERILSHKGSASALHKRFAGVSVTIFAVVLDALGNANDPDLVGFVEQLLGERDACQPVNMLSDRLKKETAAFNTTKSGHITPSKELAALMVKAWNAYMDGTDIKALRFRTGGARPEKFPEIRRME